MGLLPQRLNRSDCLPMNDRGNKLDCDLQIDITLQGIVRMGISYKWTPKKSNRNKHASGEAVVVNLEVERSESGGECEETRPVQREQTRGTS